MSMWLARRSFQRSPRSQELRARPRRRGERALLRGVGIVRNADLREQRARRISRPRSMSPIIGSCSAAWRWQSRLGRRIRALVAAARNASRGAMAVAPRPRAPWPLSILDTRPRPRLVEQTAAQREREQARGLLERAGGDGRLGRWAFPRRRSRARPRPADLEVPEQQLRARAGKRRALECERDSSCASRAGALRGHRLEHGLADAIRDTARASLPGSCRGRGSRQPQHRRLALHDRRRPLDDVAQAPVGEGLARHRERLLRRSRAPREAARRCARRIASSSRMAGTGGAARRGVADGLRRCQSG